MSKRFINFKVNARHISQLGRELVTDYNTALVEIIKNSFDADAEGAKVVFKDISTSCGKIVIIDNGSGMTQADIENKWTVIGTNNKVRNIKSPGGRKYAGKKGIGRFAVERLAEKITIFSFPSTEEAFKFSLNWNKYEQINIQGLQQRVKLLQFNKNDIESAKYIVAQIDYLLQSDRVTAEHKNEILYEILGITAVDYTYFLNNKSLDEIMKKVIDIMEIYQDEELRVQDIYHELDILSNEELTEYKQYITELKEQISSKKEDTTGIVMVLEGLRDVWKEKDIKKIQKELRLLVAPSFLEKDPFKPILSCEDYNIQEKYIVNDIIGAHYVKIDAELRQNGKQIVINYHENHTNKNDQFISEREVPFTCGDLKLELFYFLRDAKYLATSQFNINEAREIIDQYCGIKIYRDGFHVKPYGDIGNDWLLLDQRKVKDTHSYLVSNNQVIGIVDISEENNPILIDATDREGIIESEAFEDLRRFVLMCTNFISEKRREVYLENEKVKKLELAEKRRKEEEQRKKNEEELREREFLERQMLLQRQLEGAISKTEEGHGGGDIASLARHLNSSVEQNLHFFKERLAEVRRINEENYKEQKDYYEELIEGKDRELSLYKNLATIGMLTGAFGHETADIINRIGVNIQFIKNKFPSNVIQGDERIMRGFRKIEEDFKRISGYSKLIVNFVQKKNRELYDYVNFKDVICEVSDTYNRIISAQNIDLRLDLEGFLVNFKMYKIDLESIIINMITNAFEALKQTTEKLIVITCSEDDEAYKLIFEDNGVGIPSGFNEKIFSPFITTKENGVGLGLNIVKDIVDKYSGEIECYNSEQHGGAIFKITFMKERKR